MTAGEDELQALVGKGGDLHSGLGTIGRDEQAELGRENLIAANAIDGSVPCRPHQPGARVAGDALPRPSLGGDREGLLSGLLRELKVTEEADQGGQYAAPFLTEDLIERRYQYTSEGRISTAPP